MDKEDQEDSKLFTFTNDNNNNDNQNESINVRIDEDVDIVELEEGEYEFNVKSFDNSKTSVPIVRENKESKIKEPRNDYSLEKIERKRDRNRSRNSDNHYRSCSRERDRREIDRDQEEYYINNKKRRGSYSDKTNTVILKSIIYSDDECNEDNRNVFSKYDEEKQKRIVARPGRRPSISILESSSSARLLESLQPRRPSKVHLLFSQLASNNHQIRLAGFEKLKNMNWKGGGKENNSECKDRERETKRDRDRDRDRERGSDRNREKDNNEDLNEQVFQIIVSEIDKIGGADDIRKIALELVSNFSLTNTKVIRMMVSLLRLSYNDPSAKIRCSVLKALERMMKIHFRSLDDRENNLEEEVKCSVIKRHGQRQEYKDDFGSDDYYDVIKKLPFGLNDSEIVFSVISYVAANDTHRAVRLDAMNLLSKIPGNIRMAILVQSVRKDQCKSVGSGNANTLLIEVGKLDGNGIGNGNGIGRRDNDSDNSKKGKRTKTKTKSKRNIVSNQNIPILPLLCCGVFAHGIEDQFVKIRLTVLLSLFEVLKANLPTQQSSSESHNPFLLFIEVFLDALLDECDLIRLGALKFINQMKELALTVGNGLESLLAVLDDQSMDIRLEALKIIRDNLRVDFRDDRKDNESIFESLFRTQKCLEAALQKYPRTMELRGIEATYRWMMRCGRVIRDSCPEFLAHLMQSSDPKYMLFGYEIPGNCSNNNSLIQQAMQLPFMNAIQRKVGMVRLISRVDDTADLNLSLSLLSDASVIVKTPLLSENAKMSSFKVSRRTAEEVPCHLMARELIIKNKLTKLVVMSSGGTNSKFKGSYFYGNSTPKDPYAYFRVKTLKIEDGRMVIGKFEVIGDLERIKLTLIIGAASKRRWTFTKKLKLEDENENENKYEDNYTTNNKEEEEINRSVTSLNSSTCKFKTIFVVESPEIGPKMEPFKILNGTNGYIMYSTFK